MKLTLTLAGIINKEPITECTMETNSVAVSLLTYGAAIKSICEKGQQYPRTFTNLTLTLDSLEHYRENPLYAGAALGPNAGRISHGILPLPSGPLMLSQNDGPHQLHGGREGLSFRNWTLEQTEEKEDFCTALFSCYLPHGLDGYPGNRTFFARYTLTRDHTLSICYRGLTDCPTYINLSNHTYFNLEGIPCSLDHHLLQINASRYTMLRPDHIPFAIADCRNTPFDFSFPYSIAEQAKKYPHHTQLEIGRGYNHGFLFNHSFESQDWRTAPCLTLTAPISGRRLEVFTNAPAAVLYSGGFIGTDQMLDGKVSSFPGCALAVECQDVPDTPNLLPEAMQLTTPENPFERNIVFCLRKL